MKINLKIINSCLYINFKNGLNGNWSWTTIALIELLDRVLYVVKTDRRNCMRFCNWVSYELGKLHITQQCYNLHNLQVTNTRISIQSILIADYACILKNKRGNVVDSIMISNPNVLDWSVFVTNKNNAMYSCASKNNNYLWFSYKN